MGMRDKGTHHDVGFPGATEHAEDVGVEQPAAGQKCKHGARDDGGGARCSRGGKRVRAAALRRRTS